MIGTMDPRTTLTLATLDRRLEALLPQEYQDSDEIVEPVPMRSAPLKFDADGQVAWGDIWQSFCDLAMAGGPPHKGTLLRPGTPADVAVLDDDVEVTRVLVGGRDRL